MEALSSTRKPATGNNQKPWREIEGWRQRKRHQQSIEEGNISRHKGKHERNEKRK